MMNKKIIAFSGKKRCGKNSAATFAKSLLNEKYRVEELAFADAVKKSIAIILGLPSDYFFKDQSKEEIFTFYDGIKMTGREILQKAGTEALRDCFNDSVWLTNAVNKINKSQAEVILITDLRFPNELNFIKEVGGITVRINRGDIQTTDSHYSEIALDEAEFDYVINNDQGDLIYLKTEIEKFCNFYL